jgi:ParB-like chromosome segregation protein Spo0J
MKTIKVYIDGITVGPRLRDVDREKVGILADSMAKIGLQQPISVWTEPDEHNLGVVHLVAGLHRLRAAEALGWEQIDAIEVDLDEIDRRRWEIAENLHRSELTVLQRDEHVAEWIRLTELQSRQSDAIEKSKRQDGRGHRKESGTRKAAREIGVSEPDARRAVQVASLSDEAKEAARAVGLDDNRSALLEAAKAPKEKQEEVVREIAARKEAPPRTDVPKRNDLAYEALMTAWDNAPEDVRWSFLSAIPAKYRTGVAA